MTIAFSSLKNSLDGRTGLVGLHAGRGQERTGRQPHVERGARAVAVAILLAQVLVEARRERSAEDRVQHFERRVVRGRARHADPADADLRLRRFGLVDDVDLARLELRRGRHFGDERRHALGLPRRRTLLEHRHHRRGRDVADDQQRRVVGTVVRAIERLQIGNGERFDRRRQSVRRRAVAMRRPEHDARERELNQRRRIVARLQQRRSAAPCAGDRDRWPGTSAAA